MRFGGVCCCCRILHDDFNRDASGDLGDNWTEAAGVWSISSIRLVAQGTSSTKLAICDVDHPLGECAVVGQITISAGSDGCKGGLITNYTDANNYCYALVTFNTWGTDDELELYSVTGGGSPVLEAGPVDISNSGGHTLKVCHANNILTAECEGERISAQVDGSADQVGVIAIPVTPNAMSFDDFTFWRHQNEHLQRCPECKHETEETCCSESNDFYVVDLGAGGLTDTIYTACGFCDDIAGEFLVERNQQPAGSECRWTYDGNLTQCDCDDSDGDCDEPGYPGTVDIEIELTRYASGDGCKWRVIVAVAWNCSPNGVDPCGGPTATYHSAEVTTDDQDDVPITLTRTTSSTTRCGGSWPATITVESP